MWAPLFSRSASARVIADAKLITLRQSPQDVARGVTVFHTRPSRDRLLSTVRCPVIVVTGADDVAPGPDVSKAQADLHSTVSFTSSRNAATTCRWSGPTF